MFAKRNRPYMLDEAMLLATVIGVAALTAFPSARRGGQETQDPPYAHVLLLSVDGLHAFDLALYVANHPNSALAELSAHGRTYTMASATKPSNSFPTRRRSTRRSTAAFRPSSWWVSPTARTASMT